MASGFSSYSQKLQVPADTSTTGNEFGRLKMEVVTLSTQLANAQADLSAYKTAMNSNGTAKENKQSYESASQSENHALNDLHARIFILSSEINKKQQRLQKINTNRFM